MEKIVFLDFDGVLTSKYSNKKNNNDRLFWGRMQRYTSSYDYMSRFAMLDFEKIMLLKKITNYTKAKIVTISEWRKLPSFNFIEDHLIEIGIPMFDKTTTSGNRAEQIEAYLTNHEVDGFIIIDDEKSLYTGNQEYLSDYLIKTDIQDDGLTEEIVNEAIALLMQESRFNYQESVVVSILKRIKK